MKHTYPAHLIRAAQICQAVDDVRYYLNGIRFLADDQIVATDGHRLFRTFSGIELDEPVTINLSKRVTASADMVEIDFSEKVAKPYRTMANGETRDLKPIPFDVMDPVDAKRFPDHERVIPTTFEPSEIGLNATYLADVAVFASVGKYAGVRINNNANRQVVIEPTGSEWPNKTAMVIMQMRL